MAGVFVLDRVEILDRLGGDEAIYAMMVGMYLDELEANCCNLEAACQSAQAPLLHREAHTIKGLLATFSDDEGAALAYAIEQHAKSGQVDGMAEAVASLQARLRVVGEALRATR